MCFADEHRYVPYVVTLPQSWAVIFFDFNLPKHDLSLEIYPREQVLYVEQEPV